MIDNYAKCGTTIAQQMPAKTNPNTIGYQVFEPVWRLSKCIPRCETHRGLVYWFSNMIDIVI
jgi:hypothetical protein